MDNTTYSRESVGHLLTEPGDNCWWCQVRPATTGEHKFKASDLARFVALAKKGKPRDAWKAPAGVDRKVADQEYQKGDIERSIEYCKKELGLGLKG